MGSLQHLKLFSLLKYICELLYTPLKYFKDKCSINWQQLKKIPEKFQFPGALLKKYLPKDELYLYDLCRSLKYWSKSLKKVSAPTKILKQVNKISKGSLSNMFNIYLDISRFQVSKIVLYIFWNLESSMNATAFFHYICWFQKKMKGKLNSLLALLGKQLG